MFVVCQMLQVHRDIFSWQWVACLVLLHIFILIHLFVTRSWGCKFKGLGDQWNSTNIDPTHIMIIPQYQVNNKITASDKCECEIFTNYTFLITPSTLNGKSDLFFLPCLPWVWPRSWRGQWDWWWHGSSQGNPAWREAAWRCTSGGAPLDPKHNGIRKS